MVSVTDTGLDRASAGIACYQNACASAALDKVFASPTVDRIATGSADKYVVAVTAINEIMTGSTGYGIRCRPRHRGCYRRCHR